MISVFHQRQNASGDRVHTRCKQQSSIGALEFGNARFHRRVCRIAVARVKHVGVSGPQLLVGIRHLERRGLVDRLGHRRVALIEAGAAVNRFRFRTKLVPLHGNSCSIGYKVKFADRG